jgi:general secretion pathway protein G
MSGEGGLATGTLLAALAVGFLIVAAIAGFFLWIGAKLARIDGATFGRSMMAAVAAALASFVVAVILALFGLPGAGTVIGILVDILVIKSIFKTTFLKALVCWLGYLVSAFIAAFVAIALVAAGGAKPLAAKAAMAAIKQGLEKYKGDAGQYPTTEQGLRALVAAPSTAPKPKAWKGPYVVGGETILKDPWGRGYVYRGPGPTAAACVLRSAGPDGADGTSDDVSP